MPDTGTSFSQRLKAVDQVSDHVLILLVPIAVQRIEFICCEVNGSVVILCEDFFR